MRVGGRPELVGYTVLVALTFLLLARSIPATHAGVAALLAGVLALLVRAVAGRRDAPDAADGSVWDAIPAWQYEGRHVESGGLARAEQERALEDVAERAAELDDGGE